MLPRVMAVTLCALSGSLSGTATAAPENMIVVRADVAGREIERILDLDNLEVELLHPREVAAAMASIERGRAPRDFWAAYQDHVRAWRRLAEASPSPLVLGISIPADDGPARRAEAKLAIETSFDEVERIARRYGARIPIPRTRTASSY